MPKDIQRAARRKLLYLDGAEGLQDSLAPPGNRLEKLKGDRAGQYALSPIHPGEVLLEDFIWLRLQVRYDLEVAEQELSDKINREVKALSQTESHA